jgi:transketolase
MVMSYSFYEEKAKEIRSNILKLVYEGNCGHTGGSLSETDLMVALYYDVMTYRVEEPNWPLRDRFVLSKGHSVECLYCILADIGFISKEELKTYGKFGTRLIGHPNNKINGIEVNSGALGHGLPVAVGMALAQKKDKIASRVFVLLGDGELAEGSNWEAAMAAANYKLDNLYVIVDRNRLQISGNTEEVMKLEPLADKWRSFGFDVKEINGHDFKEIIQATLPAPYFKPHVIIANTIKGKGVDFMENQAKWHHGVPTDEEMVKAIECLKEGTAHE